MKALRMWIMLAAMCGAAALLALPSLAEDPKAPATDEAAKKATNAGDVELLTKAYGLADFGKEHKSPESYIAAGNLILSLKAATNGEMGELKAEPEVQDEKGNPIKDAKAETQKPESLGDIADGFFESASQLGVELKMSKEVEALIKAAKARSYQEFGKRGAKGGPKRRVQTIKAHGTHTFNIPFAGHSIAAIGFHATAPVRVRMHSGGMDHFNQVTGVGQYSWIPRGSKGETAAFTIHNPHGVKVTYELFTN